MNGFDMFTKKTITAFLVAVLRPVFILAAIILIFMAVLLRPTMASLRKHYQKETITLRQPLSEFDVGLLPSFKNREYRWEDISFKDVGTDKYIKIRFDEKKRNILFRSTFLFVTYYSDPNDQVPHTPDVCARQGGAILKSKSTITFDIPELGPDAAKVTANLLFFYEPKYDIDSIYIYLFYVSGKFRTTRDQVRWEIKRPGDKYVYFSKIESDALLYSKYDDRDLVVEECKQLLREAIPVLINKHFPTRQQIKGH